MMPTKNEQFSENPDRGYLGLPIGEASAKAEAAKRRWRVVREDGVSKRVTKDHRPDRLNFTVEGGLVAAVGRG